MNILPDKVADNLRNLDTEYDTLAAVKGYVRQQVNAHTNPVVEIKPVPMEIGNIDKDGELNYQCGIGGVGSPCLSGCLSGNLEITLARMILAPSLHAQGQPQRR